MSKLMRGNDKYIWHDRWQQLPSSGSRRSKGLSLAEDEDDEESTNADNPETDVANKFRNELIFKCSDPRAKHKSFLPQVRLRPISNLKPPTSAVPLDNANPIENRNQNQEEVRQQEILFVFQEEPNGDISTDIGRFNEKDLYGDNLVHAGDTIMDIDSPAPPATPSSVDDFWEVGVEPSGSEPPVDLDSSKDGSRPILVKKNPQNVPGQQSLRLNTPHQIKCPCCPKTFFLKCNVKTHVFKRHRFKVFSQHLPKGTPKKLVLTQVKNILCQSKVTEGGQTACKYCPRRFSAKDLKLLVEQNHTLSIHFKEIVSQLKTRISKKAGKEVSKVPNKKNDDDDDIIEIEIPPNADHRMTTAMKTKTPHQAETVKNVAGIMSKMNADIISKKTGKEPETASPDKPIMVIDIDIPSDSEDATPTPQAPSNSPSKVRIVKGNDAMIFDISSDSEPDDSAPDADVDTPVTQLVQLSSKEPSPTTTNEDDVMSVDVNVLSDKQQYNY